MPYIATIPNATGMGWNVVLQRDEEVGRAERHEPVEEEPAEVDREERQPGARGRPVEHRRRTAWRCACDERGARHQPPGVERNSARYAATPAARRMFQWVTPRPRREVDDQIALVGDERAWDGVEGVGPLRSAHVARTSASRARRRPHGRLHDRGPRRGARPRIDHVVQVGTPRTPHGRRASRARPRRAAANPLSRSAPPDLRSRRRSWVRLPRSAGRPRRSRAPSREPGADRRVRALDRPSNPSRSRPRSSPIPRAGGSHRTGPRPLANGRRGRGGRSTPRAPARISSKSRSYPDAITAPSTQGSNRPSCAPRARVRIARAPRTGGETETQRPAAALTSESSLSARNRENRRSSRRKQDSTASHAPSNDVGLPSGP